MIEIFQNTRCMIDLIKWQVKLLEKQGADMTIIGCSVNYFLKNS